ncbi:MAG TPA: Fe-S protein assembly chaperone HscA, partial [Thauera sp.]|nr:Fe-S protein assembly chaperone HscA [Thauera sp.]HHW62592.1 Hsp70 family protein [Rhodocyclaceae bacterium]
GIPPMVAGAARIRVTFQVDADGLLSVAAREMSSGVEASVLVKPSYGLSDDEIAQMLRSGVDHASDDMMARALREQQVEADRVIEATEHALEKDGDLLDPSERAAIDAAIDALRSLRAGSDHRAIKAGIDALGRATDEFAARRMDNSIRTVLAGHKVDELEL